MPRASPADVGNFFRKTEQDESLTIKKQIKSVLAKNQISYGL